MIQAEVELASTAKRLCAGFAELGGQRNEVIRVPTGRAPSGVRYIVRVMGGTESLARQAGLFDSRGVPVRGLPPAIVKGSLSEITGVWRGAFLARGSITDHGKSSLLRVTCPNTESALALVGAGRRLGFEVQAREVRGIDRVTVQDEEAIAALLTRLGARTNLQEWQQRRSAYEADAPNNRVVSFDNSNQQRTIRAAKQVSVRVGRALEILDDGVPAQFKQAAALRLAYQHASLEELGRMADPPLSKDTIAGRIRRLLAAAEKRAQELGIPAP
ncbi:DNA-binding protein WhiA [Paenarthrobacter histidinolovorans]|uniref:DNA-binding protein WhiA n=2 Tax=Paenarthrobacter histidinolovorans TaxID=43664 RepID=A0ABW8MZK7_9MICC